MKFIGIYNNGPKPFAYAKTGMMVWPDSAFIRTGKPLFIPETGNFRLFITYCVRIDRLGKYIEKRFADRYYSEIAPVAAILPEKAAVRLAFGGHPEATDIVSDCALVCGDFISKDRIDEGCRLRVAEENLRDEEDRAVFEFTLDDVKEKTDDAICFASLRNTLKTGDVIIPDFPAESLRAERDTLIKTELDGDTLLRFKLK